MQQVDQLDCLILTGQEVEVIDSYHPNGKTKLLEPKEYAVVLIEKVEWDSGEKTLTRSDVLYIYCPVSDVQQPEPDRFDDIYVQLKNEGAIQYGRE